MRSPTAVVQTLSASTDRVDRRPPASQTLYSVGYVDNGGRTSDEVARTEMSGYRATEHGSDRTTGTPGSGFPLPFGPRTTPRREATDDEGLPPRPQATGAPSAAVTKQIVHAECEHELSCNRIGTERVWPTVTACIDAMRSRSREDVAAADCKDDLDATAVVMCLRAIREASCENLPVALESLPECQPTRLCLKR